jgi:hypothetical protein
MFPSHPSDSQAPGEREKKETWRMVTAIKIQILKWQIRFLKLKQQGKRYRDTTWFYSPYLALHRDWAPPEAEAYEALSNIAKDHTQVLMGWKYNMRSLPWMKAKPNGSIINQKKEGGKNGPWFRSNHPKRSEKDRDQTSTRISLWGSHEGGVF